MDHISEHFRFEDCKTLIALCNPQISLYEIFRINSNLCSFANEIRSENAKISEHDNVVVLADKHTMPYLDGRSRSTKSRLPLDALIQASIYDINIRDFAPFGLRQLVKFSYRPSSLAEVAARQIDESMKRFVVESKLHLDKREPELILSAEHIVDNGMNKAIVDQRVLDDNHGRLPEWAIMIKLFNAFRKVTVVANPLNKTNLRLDDVMAFVDEQILVIPMMDKEARANLDAELYKKFRDEVMLVDIPAQLGQDQKGNCGLYTAILSTDKYVYVPVFGNDPENWKQGHSTMMDKMVIHMLEVNTRKTVIPVNIPRAVCERGISLRSLAWTLRGNAAEHIVQLARNTPAQLVL
ncbi:unnamed protein product [Anisakis simplex]|uniref:ULP_PROTEASE domain-containing protein n=1 Tax=Anisakis simplex TaxID=6269 RepID=A0A0M3K696_ANISI|nr:unnamed protein product [Anisakis simplex]